MPWTDDQKVAICRAFYDEGESATTIAWRFGVTRNAIIGIAHRHGMGTEKRSPKRGGLSQTSRKVKPSTAPRRQPSPRVARFDCHDRPAGERSERIPTVESRPRKRVERVLPSVRAVPLANLDRHDCRFPVSDDHVRPDAHRFCGLPAEGLGPYCGAHAFLATRT